ncbi:hypothetical protein [Roseateles asaccharophilus]|uniref:hypothetical protein n=1 Tax=Roseateles asaccharophilus TaxID=582607 RepID=UPI00384BB627
MSAEFNTRWDADVRPALEAIADAIAPLVPAYHAAWAAIGNTGKTAMEELAVLAAARKQLNDAIEPHVAEVARLTSNNEGSIRMMGCPKDEYDTWFVHSSGDPAEFLRNVARFRSFNTNFWTSQGWLGYGKGIDLPPAQRLARERAEMEALGVDFSKELWLQTRDAQLALERIGTERGYGPTSGHHTAAGRYFGKLVAS